MHIGVDKWEYIIILGTDYTEAAQRIYEENRVNPCNPCLKSYNQIII